MLRLRGKVEMPKEFFTPGNNRTQPCRLCERLLNEDPYGRLKSSNPGLVEIQSSCELPATDLYNGALNGCNLCVIISNSILTATEYETHLRGEQDFLRYIPWYRRQETMAAKSIQQHVTQSNNDDERQKGAAYAYFAETPPGTPTIQKGDTEPRVIFRSLNCGAKIFLNMKVIKGNYSTGFDLINVDIAATPSETCSKPWILIPPYYATLWLEVISDADGVFATNWKTLSATNGEWPRVARGWLDTCQKEHYCTLDNTFRPTRLIDVEDPLRPRLIETSSTATENYVTLSYLGSLDVHKIPRSVADAIEVTRQLSYRYLWVDALCIIQDSLEDKLKELPIMAKIYQQSAVTISAANSPAASEGFLKSPVPPVFKVQPFQITIGKGSPQFPYTNLCLGFREETPSLTDPIDSRGWTLQEWALSSCRLRFTSRGIQWTCNKLVVDPSSLSGEEHQDPPIQFSLDGYSQNYFREASAITSIEIRSQYAQRSLSFPTNKLAAISAVAPMAAEENKMTYVAGLWKEALLVDLQWYYIFRSLPTNALSPVTAAPDHDGEYAAPSWSWASVKYDNGTLYPSKSRKWTTDRPWHFRILSCVVEPIDGSDFTFGPVKSGYLTVEGRVLGVEWEIWTENTVALNKVSLYDHPRRESAENLGQAFLDFPSSCLERDVMLKCLVLTKADLVYDNYDPERYSNVICAHGLLLLPRPEPNTYRRVGLCYLHEASLWQESTLQSITII
ncbi:HET-domain-containing protein [Hypoxylon crocopeplum]|nr:HET-domain-containing protein [Hypoxylon crocopeplum]